MSYATSFTITQPFLGAPLQFTPALGSEEFELLIDCYVNGSASKQDKLSQVTIDFYNTATVDLNTGSLIKTYNVFPAWTEQAFEQSPTQSQSSGFSPPIFTPSPGSSFTLGDSAYGSMMTPPTRTATASGRVTKKAKKDVKKTAEARLPGFSIMTKDGIDVTSSAGRGTKTKEQREHAHLMRQLKACADCKRKKVRCDPAHRRSHNDMSRTSTSNASSSSRISPAASTPSIQDGTSFNTTSAFDDLAFFSDDFTLFPDDAAFFQDDVTMWNTAAPPMNDYMSQNLSHFNFDIPSQQDSSYSIGAAVPSNRMSPGTSPDVLFDQGLSPLWDTDNYQLQDMPVDWFSSSMQGLAVPDNIPQTVPLDATSSHLEQSYYIPQRGDLQPQGLGETPRLDRTQNVLLQVPHISPGGTAGVTSTEQVHDGHTVNAGLMARNTVLSSIVVAPAERAFNEPGVNVQSQSIRLDSQVQSQSIRLDSQVQSQSIRLDSQVQSQSVRLDNNFNVDADTSLHIDVEMQPRSALVSTSPEQTDSFATGSLIPVGGQRGNSLGQQQMQSKVTEQPQHNDPQSVHYSERQDQRLDSAQVLPASGIVSDMNANARTVLSPSTQVQSQAVSSMIIGVLSTILLSGLALVLFSGSGPLAWVCDACVQPVVNNGPLRDVAKLAMVGGLVLGLFPEVFGSSGVFGFGLAHAATAAMAFFSGSGCASSAFVDSHFDSTPFVNANVNAKARPSPSKDKFWTSSSSSSPSSFLLGLLEELTPLTIGEV